MLNGKNPARVHLNPAFRHLECQAAAPIVLAGWLALNYCDIDALAARYNAAQAAAGRLPQSAVDGLLTGLSYDGLAGLEGLPLWLREEAALDCRNWTTWSVAAWRCIK